MKPKGQNHTDLIVNQRLSKYTDDVFQGLNKQQTQKFIKGEITKDIPNEEAEIQNANIYIGCQKKIRQIRKKFGDRQARHDAKFEKHLIDSELQTTSRESTTG